MVGVGGSIAIWALGENSGLGLAALKKSPFYHLVFSVFVSAAKVVGSGFALSFVGLLVNQNLKLV